MSLSDILAAEVFKNKWFNHWARREAIDDKALFNAAQEVAEGKVDADLGGCLFKKRLPKPGQGKRGGYRVLVGYKKHSVDRIIFLYAFAKNDKANISLREEAALSLATESFVSSTEEQLLKLLTTNSLWEVECHEWNFGYCP
ncbi:MAG: type II toxin-antitoxin system RelE/ParE family toxin [Chlorobiaceae bacterium]